MGYKEFDSWLENNICIEREMDWRNEIKCVTRNTKTYTRIKNCRKNNILDNWKKIEKEKNKKIQNDQEKIKPNNKSNEWINVRKNFKQNKVNEIQQIPAMPSHVTQEDVMDADVGAASPASVPVVPVLPMHTLEKQWKIYIQNINGLMTENATKALDFIEKICKTRENITVKYL